jgi:hypothetical protein
MDPIGAADSIPCPHETSKSKIIHKPQCLVPGKREWRNHRQSRSSGDGSNFPGKHFRVLALLRYRDCFLGNCLPDDWIGPREMKLARKQIIVSLSVHSSGLFCSGDLGCDSHGLPLDGTPPGSWSPGTSFIS